MNYLSPRQLQVFVAIAEHGGVGAAAEALHLTQPAASMALAELERLLEASLFARSHGRVHLNERGRELLPLARDILERLDEFRRQAAGDLDGLRGELRLGASNTVGNYLVGDLLGDFTQTHPQVAVRLEVDNTRGIVAAVREHRLDVGCIEGAVVQPGLEVLPWRDDHLVVCARADHPLAGRRHLAAEDFAGVNWVMREHGSATRALCERALASLPPARTVLELGQIEAIKQAVIAGLGLACLPAVAVDDAVAAGRLAVLRTPFLDLGRRLSLVLAGDAYHGALVRAFVQAVTVSQRSA